MELEALEALYFNENEFVKTSSTEFTLNLLPCMYKDEGVNHVQASLHISYPPAYPTVPPVYQITSNLEASKLEMLEASIQAEIKSCVGSPMIYQIGQLTQAFLLEHNRPVQSAYDQMISRSRDEYSSPCHTPIHRDADSEDEEEGYMSDDNDEVFKGLQDKDLCAANERVTEEQFLSWAVKFTQEMHDTGQWGRRSNDPNKLSGKQLFERNLGYFDESLLDDLE